MRLWESQQERSGFVFLALFAVITFSWWTVYDVQFNSLPPTLLAEQAGESGFSEAKALQHIKALIKHGPRPVAADALTTALQYALKTAQEIQENASSEVTVEVEYFNATSGANRLTGGRYSGKTHVYSDLQHVLLRISPKSVSAGAGENENDNAILVSAHVDTVFSTEGAGDDTSNVAVMLELARGLSQQSSGFKNSVIFLFNTGEEEGLNGAHSFITQHPWSSSIKIAIDLEAMGIGGKSGIFQSGPDPWSIGNFAAAAKYPSGQIVYQDLFSTGVIQSSTDFQIYREIGGLSGLDFAFTDRTAVYHTKNDKFKLLKPGSLQHLGENMLPFLLHVASSPDLPTLSTVEEEKKTDERNAIYFDILGSYMVVFQQSFASVLYTSVIVLSLLIWAAVLLTGGYPAAVSLALSFFSIVFMLIFAVGLAVLVAFILPLISSAPTPYIASPWLVIGLFAAPALIGALAGQHLGYLVLQKYLSTAYSKKKQLSPFAQDYPVELEAERWLYKAGSIPWLLLLILGNYLKIGSSYLALAWLVPPTLAYGMLETTLSSARLPSALNPATLLMGMALPILISAGILIRLPETFIGTWVRYDSNPGSAPEWLGNVIVAVIIAVVLCLTLVYLLSYVHLSGVIRLIVATASLVLALSLIVVSFGIVPPFTEDTARTVNVVQVVDATGNQDPRSYVSMFSLTPGKLTKEAEEINEGFKCGTDKVVDFVTFSVNYGCLAENNNELGWQKSDLPLLRLRRDTNVGKRITEFEIDAKISTRWALAINFKEVEDFSLKVADSSEELVPLGDKSAVDGWHLVQFSGGKNSPKKFDLTLVWNTDSSRSTDVGDGEGEDLPLLKLRIDVDKRTSKVQTILSKLPVWCSQYGKSTAPRNLAFLSSIPVDLSRIFSSNLTHNYEYSPY